jgi:hypothetical protein
MTQQLFRRAWRVQVGPFASTDLDIAFKVERTTSARPGRCELTLWGLSGSQRAEILAMPRRSAFGSAVGGTAPQTIVELSAGYEGATRPMIFRGNLRRAKQKREHPEWAVELSAADGSFAMQSARGSRAFSADASLRDVIRDLADSMEVGRGNVDDTSALAALGRVGALFPSGTALHGPARDQMTTICRAAGLEWSVQSGALRLLPRGRALGRSAIVLSEDTGLVGSPETNGRHRAKAKCLMIAGLEPGCLVELRSSIITGTYRVGHMTLSGDTRGQDWGAELELTSLAYYESRRLFR